MNFRQFLESRTAPRIFDADALDRMAKVEGVAWRRKQIEDKSSPHGFFAHLKAWEEIERQGYRGEISPGEMINMGEVPGVKGTGDGTIYGEAGYARYKVSKDGTIKFDYGMVRKEKQELAQQEGFPPY